MFSHLLLSGIVELKLKLLVFVEFMLLALSVFHITAQSLGMCQ